MLTEHTFKNISLPSIPLLFLIKNLIFPAMELLIPLPHCTSGSWKLNVISGVAQCDSCLGLIFSPFLLSCALPEGGCSRVTAPALQVWASVLPGKEQT